MAKERRLGRGLAALLGTPLVQTNEQRGTGDTSHNRTDDAYDGGTASTRHADGPQPDAPPGNNDALLRLSVYDVDDNPFQPRRDFSESELASLAESLKEHDMLQPILVRRVGERYQLISGERRLRAAIKAGWSTIPARVREADDRLVAELAIVENLQRKDLNAIEKALSFKRYLNEHRCLQEDLAQRLKIDRSTIANLLRLLELPDAVQEAVREGTITAGHARALLPLGDEQEQVSLCKRITSEGMSVREVERHVQETIAGDDVPATIALQGRRRPQRSQQVAALEQQLRMSLGTRVDVRKGSRGQGRIVVHFTGADEFDRLHQLLTDAHSSHQQHAAG